MAANLILRYDKVGDILYIETRSPYREQDSEDLEDEIGVRLNPSSGEVEIVEINFFSKRLSETSWLVIPVNATLLLPS